MAELLALNTLGGAVGDTFRNLEIESVISDGNYNWVQKKEAVATTKLRTLDDNFTLVAAPNNINVIPDSVAGASGNVDSTGDITAITGANNIPAFQVPGGAIEIELALYPTGDQVVLPGDFQLTLYERVSDTSVVKIRDFDIPILEDVFDPAPKIIHGSSEFILGKDIIAVLTNRASTLSEIIIKCIIREVVIE